MTTISEIRARHAKDYEKGFWCDWTRAELDRGLLLMEIDRLKDTCPHGHTRRRKCSVCDREDDLAKIVRLQTALTQIFIGAAEACDGLTYDEIAKIADEALKESNG